MMAMTLQSQKRLQARIDVVAPRANLRPLEQTELLDAAVIVRNLNRLTVLRLR